MRVNRKKLEEKVAVLNKLSGESFCLDFNRDYGGYCLESNQGSRCHSPRISASQLWWFLAGQIEVYDRQAREEIAAREAEFLKGATE